MASKDVLPLYRRLLKTKAALLAVSFTLIGILLIMLNAWLATLSLGDWSWLHHLPLDEVGGPLLGAGLVSTILDYSYRRDQEDVAIQRTQQAIVDPSPAQPARSARRTVGRERAWVMRVESGSTPMRSPWSRTRAPAKEL